MEGLTFELCPPQVFPPVPMKLDYSFFDREKLSRALVPKEGKPCPAYITPITGESYLTRERQFDLDQ